MPFRDDFLNSAFSVDNVIFGFDKGKLKILLIKRNEDPYKDMWALPGELVFPDEDLDDAPLRVLKEATGLSNVFLEQVQTFGKVKRHPLGRVITVAYYSLVNINKVNPKAAAFAQEVGWIDVYSIKELAFDHFEIMTACLKKLKLNLGIRPIGFELLKEKFTLSELQSLYETVLDKPLDKRNFRKKILSMKILEDVKEYQSGVAHRPAKLYKFNRAKYLQSLEEGFSFDI
jgi:8-oxo-dGTP diphosphatase